MIQDFIVTRTVVIILVSTALGMVARTCVLAIKAKDKAAIAFSSTIGLFLFSMYYSDAIRIGLDSEVRKVNVSR